MPFAQNMHILLHDSYIFLFRISHFLYYKEQLQNNNFVPVTHNIANTNYIWKLQKLTQHLHMQWQQEALLLERDCVTRLSVEILQLQNIPFEN